MKRILILFVILFTTSLVIAQPLPNDCSNAITVCGNGTFFSNASGIGTLQEINGASCGGSESNSLWLKITIASSVIPGSTLGFDLIPNDPSTNVDYDFYVFPANAVCGALGNAIRCCTTNPGPAPFGAALSNNITGMYGSTLQTAVGPGPSANSSGDDYVRWLSVIPGQTYYIAIDRPEGDGGFQIQWTGTAITVGPGAFSTAPTANSIAALKTCSNTPNVGIFSLDDTVRSLINSSITFNTISFHTTIENAIDNIDPLDPIFVTTSNPQTIYVRVTDNLSGCFSTTSFDLVVNLVPTAAISVSNAVICEGDSITVTYTGTPGATFDYTINSGPLQTAIFPATGVFTVNETLTTNRTYTLNGVRNLDTSGNIICNQPLTISKIVSVNPLPTATITGTTTICSGTTTTITFSGTPDATVTYTINGGTNQTILLNGTGDASITTPALTATTTYALVSVTSPGSSVCSQPQSGSAIVTIALPTATISGTTSICSGATTTITFSGTPDATVTYTINGGTNQTILLNGTGDASITTPALTATTTYALVSVTSPGSSVCSQPQSGSAIVTIALPTATISGTTSICSGTTTTITFSGTPDATVTYTINGGTNQTILLNGTGDASITTPALTATTTYALVSVTSPGSSVCSQPQSGSAIVTIALPTATISGTTSICSGTTTTITFSGTPDATVTYTINGGTNQTILLNGAGDASITTPALTANATYALVSVTSPGSSVCSQPQSGSAIVTIALPTATISGTTSICSGTTTTITFSGTPDATVTYTINGGTNHTILLNGTGDASITTPALTATTTYALVSVTSPGSSVCSQPQSGSAIVTIALPTATISGTTSICSGATTTITFSGTPDATVTYTINGGTNQTILLNGTGDASITTPALTATTTYALVSVTSPGSSVCSQPQSGSAIVTIALPTATITGTTTICSGTTTTITFSGTPDATVTYTINGGANQTILLNGTGDASITTPALTATTTYALVSVTSPGSSVCSQPQSGSAIVTIALPTATISGTTSICIGTITTITFSGFNGIAPYTFIYSINDILQTPIISNISGTYQLSVPTNVVGVFTYKLISVQESSSSLCARLQAGSAVVSVTTAPIISQPIDYIVCDDYVDPSDGIFQLDLTQYETTILNGQDPLIFLISYYHSQSDAEAGSNAITLSEAQEYITKPDSDKIWVKVVNSNNTVTSVCYALTTIDITIDRSPNPIIGTVNGVNTICVDFTTNNVVRALTLDSGITNPSDYTFKWFEDGSTTPIPGATGPTYTIDTAAATGATRNYTVTVTSINTPVCPTTSVAFPVIQSGQAEIRPGTLGYIVTNAFASNQIITVHLVDILGYGTYEYSLDEGPRQVSNIFEGVSFGRHVIHIWDTKGSEASSCDELIIEDILIIDYPRYFTPNGDGIHDTWNIVGLGLKPETKVYIFDRYGKLLKQIISRAKGWDGTYNGQPLPATDYWFTVDYVEQNVPKQFKAHFSLKR